ncbi:MAG: hypothetical protein H0T47_19700 [Planctomycetaceae bacterium]|nr:hypothetical protein [Planctomycetaceae bacterium]
MNLPVDDGSDAAPPLAREEYIEQEHFFRVLRERTATNVPVQDALSQIREEILATTNLPYAIDFLRTEALHGGRLNPAMTRLAHYFTPFQTYIIASAEGDSTKFDMATALLILERLAGFMADKPTRPGLFIYQFECIARNRLGYDAGLKAAAADAYFDDHWGIWINRVRGMLGTADFADLIYFRSAEHVDQVRRRLQDPERTPEYVILFGSSEGRIARASRGKDPLYMFAALQRQLGYPRVPRVEPKSEDKLPPALEARLARLEKRLTLLEAETKGTGIDLSEFMKKPPDFRDPSSA